MGTVESEIIVCLEAAFSPLFIEVKNESHMHAGPPDRETHFNVTLVSSGFEGLRQVQRHQAVYRQVTPYLERGVHALALHTYTPAEWNSSPHVSASPNCLGGSRGK
jgi:BolA protein